MRRFVALSGLWSCLAAQSPPAFVEVDPAQAELYVEQPLHGVLRVGYDAAWFREHGVDLFAQRFDLPFALRAPWLAGDEAQGLVWPTPWGEAVRRGVVGDDVRGFTEVAPRREGDRTFTVLEAPFVWFATASGAGPGAAVELRYAFASAFTEDFLRGRQPVDRQQAQVQSIAPAWTVRELPTDGRPAAFRGAVGRFAVRAAVATPRVEVGQEVSVTLSVSGDGNLQRFDGPPLPELEGFHVQGVVERRAEQGREFVFDVLPLRAGLDSLPPLPFTTFDPGVGRYVVLHTSPVPLQVVPAADEAALPARVQLLILRDAERRRAADALPAWAWPLLGLAAVAAGFGLRASRRRGARRAVLREALEALQATEGGDASARLAAFERICALVVGRAAFEPAVWQELARPAVDAGVVAAVRQAHGKLADAVYGGVPPGPDEVLGAAQRLVSRIS